MTGSFMVSHVNFGLENDSIRTYAVDMTPNDFKKYSQPVDCCVVTTLISSGMFLEKAC